MAIVTLTTDWNRSDYYVGSVKGKLLSHNPALQIVDISHQVQAFNIMQAAFILRNCCFDFPKGTIHLIAVNAALSKKRALLLIEMQGHYFLSSDNGIIGLLSGEKPDAVFKVRDTKNLLNFVSLEIFVETIDHLLKGDAFDTFCDPITSYEQQTPYRPVIDKNLINGSVIYIDSFSNAITNISRDTFEKIGQGKLFEVFIQSNHYKIDRINQTYSDSVSGELLALFNSIGLLEVAINNGSAAELLNLTINSAIRVKFYEEKPGSKLTLSGG
jgi:S-adenosyl-L-methionine hydrolase (adenosine-forming)